MVALLGDVGCTDGTQYRSTKDLPVEVWHYFSLQLVRECVRESVRVYICSKEVEEYGNEEIEKESERKRKKCKAG